MSVDKRLKQLRQTLNLSQAKFAEGISVSNGYIAGMETGKRKVNERVIRLVSSTYGVNEKWLRSGEGKMFDQEPDTNLTRMVAFFKELRPEFQDYVLQQIDQLLDLQKKTNAEGAPEKQETP